MTRTAHPDYLPSDLTVKHLQDWKQYEKQAGFRDDIHWGMLMCLIANQYRDKNDLTTPEEFMPYYEIPLPDQDEVEDKLKAMFQKRRTKQETNE